MPNVHSNDAYTWLDMVPESVYGTDPGAGYLRVPLLGETNAFVRRPVEASREIRGFGATPSGSYGLGRVEGTVRTLGYYNAPWFHTMLCHAMGGTEERYANVMPDGTVAAGENVATHVYLPQSYKMTSAGSIGGRPIGMTVRAGKSGTTDAGSVEKFLGMLVRTVEFRHAYSEHPQFVWTLVGRKSARLAAAGLAPPAVGVHQQIGPDDIKMNAAGAVIPSKLWAGTALPEFQITGIQWRIETPIEFPEPYANDLDGDYEPAIVGNRACTGRLEYRLHQAHHADGKAIKEFLDGTLGSQIRIRYCNSLYAGSTGVHIGVSGLIPYTFDVHFGNVTWFEGETPTRGPGVITGFVGFRAVEATFQTSGHAQPSGNRKGPLYIGIMVANADDLSAKFVAAGLGGNNLHSTLT